MRSSLVALVVLAIGSAGCSFIFVRPAHEDLPDRGASECTSVAAAPMIDLVLAGASALSLLYVSQKNDVNKGSSVALTASAAAMFTISSAYGFVKTSRCTDLQSEPEEPIRPTRPRRRPAPVVAPAPVAPPPERGAPVSPIPRSHQQLDSE